MRSASTIKSDLPRTSALALDGYLARWAGDQEIHVAVARTVDALAGAAVELSHLVSRGTLLGTPGAAQGEPVAGDQKRALDDTADRYVRQALKRAPVAAYGSEELDEALILDPSAPLAVVVDPLDGSSNIDTNVSVGTIFSIFAVVNRAGGRLDESLLQPGTHQLGAGFFVYGPQLTLVVSVGAGTQVFIFDRTTGSFVLSAADVRMPEGQREYAINASNYRHWDEPVRFYIDDCLAGNDGPNGANYNTRWIASLVAEAFRLFARGGVFLYPADSRPGYESGRLRLVYEANPLAYVVEQAGGAATDGHNRILDLTPASLHQRVPLVFGSRDEVERIRGYYIDPQPRGQRSPLFDTRGLLRTR